MLYDVLIVGAGIAGSSLAHALATSQRPDSVPPLRIGLLERSLAEPDRIVGELLQPGGVGTLRALGLAHCLDGIDAVPVYGYCVYDAVRRKTVHVPYPSGYEGRSFHHGRFVSKLRDAARAAKGVYVIEATVTDLVQCELTRRVVGVHALRRDRGTEIKETITASLVVVADGCLSNFRNLVFKKPHSSRTITRSHFVGAILEDARLPIAHHGTVALVKGHGPVLLYQISERDTRILVDVKNPLPKDLKSHILTQVVPQLPQALHLPAQRALSSSRLRRMPNSFLPAAEQGGPATREGVLLLGDAWNMRHPLTGGGMTVALADVAVLAPRLAALRDLSDWEAVAALARRWHWRRKPFSATINILSVALYDLFGADDENLDVLRTGCFKYFERGGECVGGPVSLLSGIAPSPLLLTYHFYAVAVYAVWVLFTHPRPRSLTSSRSDEAVPPRLEEYPALCVRSVRVLWTACVVFGPLLWSEIRWW